MSNSSSKKQPKQSKTPGKGKIRHRVRRGDLVSFESHIAHMTGNFGEVVQVIDKDHVVVRGMGTQYVDYNNRLWVVLTYKPTGMTSDGERWRDLTMWVRDIQYSREALPPKVKKPKRPVEQLVIENQDQLLQVLSGGTATTAAKVHIVSAPAAP